MTKSHLIVAVFAIIGIFWIASSLDNQAQVNSKIVELEEKKLAIEEKRLTMEQQKHIDNLYSIYQENMSTCKNSALEQRKDETFIKENCTDAINNSIIANWLKELGQGNLIKNTENNSTPAEEQIDSTSILEDQTNPKR